MWAGIVKAIKVPNTEVICGYGQDVMPCQAHPRRRYKKMGLRYLCITFILFSGISSAIKALWLGSKRL